MKNKISDLEEGEKIVHIEHGKCIVKEKLSCSLYLHGLENKFKGLVSKSIHIDFEKTNELNNNINMDKISEEIISIIKDSKDGIIKQEYLIDKLNKYEENIIIIGINGLIVEGILSCNRLLPDNELYVYIKNNEQSQTSAPLKEEKIDNINDPAHYGGNDNPYEVIKVIEAWGLDKDAYIFNVIKYTARAGKKDETKEIEDLEKARYYLDRKINNLKNK